jgi:hypothetical protein
VYKFTSSESADLVVAGFFVAMLQVAVYIGQGQVSRQRIFT